MLSGHPVVDIAKKPKVATAPPCDVHKGKTKDVYCTDCKVRACAYVCVFVWMCVCVCVCVCVCLLLPIHCSAVHCAVHPLQVAMCISCRFESHKNHAFDLIENVSAADKARVTAAGKRCTEWTQQLQRRREQLLSTSRAFAQSVTEAEAEVKRVIGQLRTAADQRERQLLSELNQMQQVCAVVDAVGESSCGPAIAC